MKIHRFQQYIFEDLVSDLKNKVSNNNSDIKQDLIEIIQKSTDSENKSDFDAKIDSIVKNPNDMNVRGLNNDSDIYEFYLKYRNEIDEILEKSEFFSSLQDFQKDNNLISLYDFVIKATKKAIQKLAGSIKEETESSSTEEPTE